MAKRSRSHRSHMRMPLSILSSISSLFSSAARTPSRYASSAFVASRRRRMCAGSSELPSADGKYDLNMVWMFVDVAGERGDAILLSEPSELCVAAFGFVLSV